MEFEFDKEIDAILRKARESEFVFANNPKFVHLDADEISAFAENALPEKSKTLYTAHFAECDRCRRILSNLIALNAETVMVSVSSAASETVAETPIPWYRKLFAMPNLAYTTGAFVLVFGGFLGVLVLQNFDKPESSLSQATEPLSKERGPSASQDSAYSNSNAATTTANAANVATNTATVSTNSAANTSGAPLSNATASNTTSAAANQPVYSSNSSIALSDEAADSANSELSGKQPKPSPPVASAAPMTDAETAPEKNKEEQRKRSAEPMLSATPPPAMASGQAAPAPRKSVTRNERDDAKADKSPAEKESATRQIAGKTFRRADSGWTDRQYRTGILLRNIARGSSDYKKLDGGLKNIAESLDGIVIVIWKSKGYRIQ